jgi:pSer/pThr/pTyr-binding forkhead associated (FHA) protein
MAHMTMRRGPEPGRIYELKGDRIKIGRGRRNHIIIHDNEVSREHCELTLVGDDYELRDLGSSNGTFVNGQRVGEDGWVLKSDCIVEIGDSITFEFVTDNLDTEPISPIAQPYLVVLTESNTDKPEIYPLHGDVIFIGRDLTSTIVIQEPEVSRQHLCLRFSELGYMAEDLGSTNGTFLNGEELAVPRLLRLNDVLELGTMVKLLYTDNPSKYLSEMKTDILPGPDDDTILKRTIDSSDLVDRITRRRTDTSELGIGFQPGALVGYIFIAFAPEEWDETVSGLYNFLDKRHLSVWVNEDLAYHKGHWETILDQVVSECNVLMIVVSELSLDKEYVRRAWRYFHSREKPIILVVYDFPDPLPMELRNLPTITYNPDDPEETYKEVIAEVMRLGL